MPKPEKIEAVKKISDKLSRTKVFVVIENKGMTVEQATLLRKKVRESRGEIRVFKNTLLKIAIKETLGVEFKPGVMNGSLLVGFAFGDPIQTVKTLSDFVEKDEAGQKLSFKAGIMDKKILGVADISALSRLPGRELLLAQLLATIQAPATQLVGVLQAPARDLVGVLNAYKNKLEEGKN